MAVGGGVFAIAGAGCGGVEAQKRDGEQDSNSTRLTCWKDAGCYWHQQDAGNIRMALDLAELREKI